MSKEKKDKIIMVIILAPFWLSGWALAIILAVAAIKGFIFFDPKGLD